ncbi:hypothetical protein BS50DRAFT_574756 [Corynespora cassiicola Philippines]|uniref:Uncharacterized protein n=1 Tax=Corynespora cassiicola Philippines TaxID=1448308 RepID=A0A2T2NLJ1_CORCC|nr:hypothetical protein BS50DRAFT_574756 [Corynespora cassiicola Philippines]
MPPPSTLAHSPTRTQRTHRPPQKGQARIFPWRNLPSKTLIAHPPAYQRSKPAFFSPLHPRHLVGIHIKNGRPDYHVRLSVCPSIHPGNVPSHIRHQVGDERPTLGVRACESRAATRRRRRAVPSLDSGRGRKKKGRCGNGVVRSVRSRVGT